MKKFLTLLLLFSLSHPPVFSQIKDIKVFLDQCPTKDPIFDTLLKDFEIRHNDDLVTSFPCSEPVSSLPVAGYDNPLIYLQTLRTVYYMDKHMSASHLPWTSLSLYQWMKKNVDGINIKDGVVGGYCCEDLDGKTFFVIGSQDEAAREFDKGWRGIAGNIDLIAHEIRHMEGSGYIHSSCCGVTNGCDDEYNENDLGAYGIQYWLNKSWLTGFINVGARSSGTASEISDIINWHLSAANTQYRSRFCNQVPALIDLKDVPTPLGPGTSGIFSPASGLWTVFPNPVKAGETLKLRLNGLAIYRISLYNSVGVLSSTEEVSTRELTLSTAELKPDLYILKMEDASGASYFQKLMVRN